MAEPTPIEVFGAGTTQTATSITILKADLTGLTPSATNTAESLFVAIVLKAGASLTSANRDSNPDRSIAIDNGFDRIAYRGTTPYYQSARTIQMYMPIIMKLRIVLFFLLSKYILPQQQGVPLPWGWAVK